MTNRDIDIICIGELLIDMISEGFAGTLSQADRFVRWQGGSPANLALNMHRLGGKVALVASVGIDNMGQYLLDEMAAIGLDTQYIRRCAQPTTLILVTRSQEVSAFEAYRGADAQILPEQLPLSLLSRARFFHTTCFALSQAPARSTILEAARRAVDLGLCLSIDANYAEKIGPDRKSAQEVLTTYCQMGPLVKISEVDWERLYASPLREPQQALEYFLKLGAREVCVTMGGEGCFVGNSEEQHFLPARSVEVKDTTGAGDAFWSGYLIARIDDLSLLDSARAGRRMAELKLAHFGPLPGKIERTVVYEG